MEERKKAEPNLQVFALDDEGYIWNGTMQWPSGGSGGLVGWNRMQKPPKGCIDVHATSNDKGQIFYWMARTEGIFPDSLDPKASLPAILKVTAPDRVKWGRAVFRPKAIGDDPDENQENPRVLNGIEYIVYAGLEKSNRICVLASGAESFQGVVLAPKGLDSYYGIDVDQRFLWVSGSRGVFHASHTSIIQSIQHQQRFRGKDSSPRWVNVYPNASYNDSVSACEDHSLCSWNNNDHTVDFLSYGTDYWKFEKGLHGLGYKGNNRAKQVQKLPSYRWSMVGGLIESLRLWVVPRAPVTPVKLGLQFVGVFSKDGLWRLDIGTESVKKKTPETTETWATKLVIRRLDATTEEVIEDSGPVCEEHVVGIFSEDGQYRLDIGTDSTIRDTPAATVTSTTKLFIGPPTKDSQITPGVVHYGDLVGIFSEDGLWRLDIGTDSMKKNTPTTIKTWATVLKIRILSNRP